MKSRDERLTHRLEAFSDIVIGFSLAQMSVNLGIPRHANDVYTHPIAFFAFGWTFLVIAAFWWSHHRLFDAYFVPTPATVTFNFVALAALVWLVYQLQVFVHFAGTTLWVRLQDSRFAFRSGFIPKWRSSESSLRSRCGDSPFAVCLPLQLTKARYPT